MPTGVMAGIATPSAAETSRQRRGGENRIRQRFLSELSGTGRVGVAINEQLPTGGKRLSSQARNRTGHADPFHRYS